MLHRDRLKSIFIVCCIGILVCAALVFPGFHQTSHVHAAAPSRVRVLSNVYYGPMPEEDMEVCLPEGGSSTSPGIIMIHGGSWVGGDKSRYSEMCSDYAAEGYVAATINYRLAPEFQWPDQIGDVQLAVRYLRANAFNYGLDTGRICALGDSAGAQLALLLDELQTIHPADVASLYADVSPSVLCVVDQFGPTDLAQLYGQNPSVQQFMYYLLDDQVPPAPIYADASPYENITAQTGRALIIQGTQDQTVLPEQSLELDQAFLKDGFSPQYISYVGDHEYGGLSPAQVDVIMSEINTFLNTMEQPGNPHNAVKR